MDGGIIPSSRCDFMWIATRCANIKLWALSTKPFLKSSVVPVVFYFWKYHNIKRFFVIQNSFVLWIFSRKEIKIYSTKFQCLFSAIISTPSNTGKWTLLLNILQCQEFCFLKNLKRFLVLQNHQFLYNDMLKINLVDELIEVVVVDDMISEN